MLNDQDIKDMIAASNKLYRQRLIQRLEKEKIPRETNKRTRGMDEYELGEWDGYNNGLDKAIQIIREE